MDDFNNNEGVNLSKTPDEPANNEGVNLSKTPDEPVNNESVNLSKTPDEPVNNEAVNLSKTPDEPVNNESVNLSKTSDEPVNNESANLSKTPDQPTEPENNESVNLFKSSDEPVNNNLQGESHAQSQQNVNFGGQPNNSVPASAPESVQSNQTNGTPIYNNIYVEQPKNNGASGMAITSLVLGILSILGGCCCNFWAAFLPLNLPFAVIGLVLGIMQNKKEKSGIATGGIVTNAIGLAFALICLVIWVLAFIGVMASPELYLD